MLPAELELYLHEHIPLSAAMQVKVISIKTESVVLQAPLAPNINHRETVFGGSASALAILAAWSLLHTRLQGENIHCRLVIQRNSIEYDRPIAGDFTARSRLASEQAWPRFLQMLLRSGRARLSVTAVLEYAGQISGQFSGEFVALNSVS